MRLRREVFPCVVAAMAGIALLAGCALEPAPDRTQIRDQAGITDLAMADSWKGNGSFGAIEDNWLTTFADDKLNALVVEAIANNPDLRVAAVNVEQAGQYLELARSTLGPTINIFGLGGLKMGGGDMSSALQGISLGVSWEPDIWGRLRYGLNAAEESHASAMSDYQFACQSLAATLAKAWFTASETWLQIQLSKQMVSSAEVLVRLAEKRWQVGAGTEQDLAMARASLGSYQDGLRQMRHAHGQSLRALELLLGRYPASELEARTTLVPLPGPAPAGFPLEMLERRPDLIAAERRVAAAFNRVGEAKAARLPNIFLNANVAALYSEVLQLKDDFTNPTGGIGAKLLTPVYDGGALATKVEIRTLEQKEAVAQYAGMALRALGDVENALAAGETLADRRTLLQQTVKDNRRAYDLAQASYRVGRGDLRSVQQQQLSLNGAQLALLRVQSEELSQRVNLHLALGGNFMLQSIEESKPGHALTDASRAVEETPVTP